MRKACRKILGSVPCARRKSLPSDSTAQDMEEILRSKLSTIKEEPESCEENLKPARYNKWMAKILRKKNAQAKDKRGGCLVAPHHVDDLKHSYVLFITGFASKGTFAGFLHY